MTEFNSSDFDGAFEFLLLSEFREGPRSVSEIQRCCKRAEWLLGLAAARKGKRGIGSLPTALERLQREGWLRLELPEEQAGAEIIYSLTKAGEQRLEQGRAHRNWIVSQFVENSELDQSFRRFLDRQGPLWPS
jgi:DNA-binding PadR family transcriptional regulator